LDGDEPTAVSNSSGNYKFANLKPGTYSVMEIAPKGYRVSTPSTWFANATVTVGGTATAQPFGNTQLALAMGRVFSDANRNKKQARSINASRPLLRRKQSTRARDAADQVLMHVGVKRRMPRSVTSMLSGTSWSRIGSSSTICSSNASPQLRPMKSG